MRSLPVVLLYLAAVRRAAGDVTTPSSSQQIGPDPLEEASYANISSYMAQRIVGGHEAKPGQFPYQAALYISPKEGTGVYITLCGGSIISARIVMTAAHCTPAEGTRRILVHVGVLNMQEREESRKVYNADAFYPHEDFDKNLNNDISLVLLNTSIEFNENVQPIKLPSPDIGPLESARVVMSGWGRTSTNSNISPVLRWVESSVLTNDLCKVPYILFAKIQSSHICTSGWFMKGTCMGDSGGPLTLKGADGTPVVVGITSFGIKVSCNLSWPTVFSRVSSYLDWIATATADLAKGPLAKVAKRLQK